MPQLTQSECGLMVFHDPLGRGRSVLWSRISGECMPMPGIFLLRFNRLGWAATQLPGSRPTYLALEQPLFVHDEKVYLKHGGTTTWLHEANNDVAAKCLQRQLEARDEPRITKVYSTPVCRTRVASHTYSFVARKLGHTSVGECSNGG